MAINKQTLGFLTDLKVNNNKEWFTENKAKFDDAKENFTEFVEQLIGEISKFDPNIGHLKAKDCVFRIYRDVRFSKDKSPYKSHFGAHITAANSKTDVHSKSGYYVHLEPNNATMLAGGAYMPESNWLKRIRQEIDYNGAELIKIIENPKFKEYFGTMSGEKLARNPKGYAENHEFIDLLKMKSFLATHFVKDTEITKLDFINNAAEVYKTIKPLGDFLNREE